MVSKATKMWYGDDPPAGAPLLGLCQPVAKWYHRTFPTNGLHIPGWQGKEFFFGGTKGNPIPIGYTTLAATR